MKRMTVKEILAASFRELAGSKSIDRITIREITDNCGYSPATFYRHFTDKFDLIAWDYACRSEEIMGRIGTDGYTWVQTLTDGARYFRDDRKYLKNLLIHTSGHESFVRHVAETNIRLLEREMLRSSEAGELPADIRCLARIYCYGTVQMICEWIMEESSVTPEQMSALFEQALPGPLRRYLGLDRMR